MTAHHGMESADVGNREGYDFCSYCSNVMDARICEEIIYMENGIVLACTREPQHAGNHVACGAHHNIFAWPNDPAHSGQADE